jgi:two-component system, NarL family, sensor histidine kinase UhpB
MQKTSSAVGATSSVTHPSIRRDITIVIGVIALSGYLAAHFELNERVFSVTRRYEGLQLDEWPIVVFVLALCLMWMVWRRYRLALAELHARQLAEARLTQALAENRELARQNLRALEAERKHLARELHDELGQYLNAIKLDAVAAGHDEEPETQDKRTRRMLAAVDHIHGVVRDMIRRLRPAGLDELGLSAALEGCIDQWQERLPGTQFSFHADGDLDNLSEHVNLTVYRLVQEGLTNSFKHAAPSRIDIVLNRTNDANEVVLSLSDNGTGADLTAKRSGMGLNGMRERAQMLGGTLAVETAPGRGFTVQARIPVEGRL